MKHLSITIIACLFFMLGRGQNLVLNPGFEAGTFPGAYSPIGPGSCPNWDKGCPPANRPTVHQPPYVFPLASSAGNKYAALSRGENGQPLRGELSQLLPKGNYIFDMDFTGVDWPGQGHVPGTLHVMLLNSAAGCDGTEMEITYEGFGLGNSWQHRTVCFTVEQDAYFDRIEFWAEISSNSTPGQNVAVVAVDEIGLRSSDLILEDFDNGGSFTSDLSPSCTCTNGSYCIVNDATSHCSSLIPVVGSGNFMSVINDNPGELVWRSAQAVNIVAGSTYEFSMLANDYATPTGPNLEVRLNDGSNQIAIDTYNDAGSNVASWEELETTFIAPNSGSYFLEIVQLDNTDEQDYGLDEIKLQERGCCEAKTPEKLDCLLQQAGVLWTLIYSWEPVPNATYEVRIFHNGQCCFPERKEYEFIPTSAYFVDDPALIFSVYFLNLKHCIAWRVRAICPDGNTSDWSPPQCICYDQIPSHPNHGGKRGLDALPLAEGQFSAFPNPSNNHFDFKIESSVPVYNLTIMDMNGRIIESMPADRSDRWVPGQDVENGTYFAVVQLQNGEILFNKIVLMR